MSRRSRITSAPHAATTWRRPFLSLIRRGSTTAWSPGWSGGFDYYTRTVFEVINAGLGAQNAVCGGGRYDHLSGRDRRPPMPRGGVCFRYGEAHPNP